MDEFSKSVCVYNTLQDNPKNTAVISLILVGTLGTLGQHEFAFGFCDSTGVEISRVTDSLC